MTDETSCRYDWTESVESKERERESKGEAKEDKPRAVPTRTLLQMAGSPAAEGHRYFVPFIRLKGRPRVIQSERNAVIAALK